MAKNVYQFLLAGLSLALSTGCSGNSRPDAIVTAVDGGPCFAVPANRQTRDGIPLYGLLVSEREARKSMLPSDLWIVSVKPAGAAIKTRPESCIRYGITPAGAEGAAAFPLQPYHIYTVDLNARPEDSDIHSYSAEFCIKPAADGKVIVQVVPWDDNAKRWKYDVCNKS
ncbi:MAG: hypothetical protein WKG03_16335 [Telluria sp.]